jgi:hypothetical protein
MSTITPDHYRVKHNENDWVKSNAEESVWSILTISSFVKIIRVRINEFINVMTRINEC